MYSGRASDNMTVRMRATLRRCDQHFEKAPFNDIKGAPAEKGSRKAFRINDLWEEEQPTLRSSRYKLVAADKKVTLRRGWWVCLYIFLIRFLISAC